MIRKIINKNVLEFMLIFLVTLVSFFTFKTMLPSFILLALSICVSVYFFPISLIYNKLNNIKLNSIIILSNLVICWIIILSPIVLFTKNIVIIDYLVFILLISNLFYVFYYIKYKNQRVIQHFGASLLVSLFVII